LTWLLKYCILASGDRKELFDISSFAESKTFLFGAYLKNKSSKFERSLGKPDEANPIERRARKATGLTPGGNSGERQLGCRKEAEIMRFSLLILVVVSMVLACSLSSTFTLAYAQSQHLTSTVIAIVKAVPDMKVDCTRTSHEAVRQLDSLARGTDMMYPSVHESRSLAYGKSVYTIVDRV